MVAAGQSHPQAGDSAMTSSLCCSIHRPTTLPCCAPLLHQLQTDDSAATTSYALEQPHLWTELRVGPQDRPACTWCG